MAGVDYVFHAAALKQVPSCEFFPMEALRTNALGTENVLNAAIALRRQARRSSLSTDKAVYPINAMGISKAMMEKLMVAKSRVAGDRGTVICGTRYGNVMASRGSVIPLFIKQIQAGQAADRHRPEHDALHDVASTTRWTWCSTPSSTASPATSSSRRRPPRPSRRSPQAVKKVFKADNPIEVIGTRHGEKLYETLLTREEMAERRGPGRLLPRPGRQPRPELRALLHRGAARMSRGRRTTTRTTRRALDVDEMAELLLEARLRPEALRGEKIEL